MNHVKRKNASGDTHHIRVSHVTHRNESCVSYELVFRVNLCGSVVMNHVKHKHGPGDTHHIRISHGKRHVTPVNESCRTYE